MKTKSLFLIIIALFISGFYACKEKENKNKIIKILKDEPAYIIKGCFEYSRIDSFSIELENYPEGIIAIFPCAEIPEQYRIENCKVLVSGNILNDKEFNACDCAPNIRIFPTNLFELTNIKNN